MNTQPRKKRHYSTRRRKPCLKRNAATLSPEQLDQTWADYARNHDDLSLRNRLVEHYLPFVYDLSFAIAKKMRLRDKGNAVGEVLAALVEDIVPRYDGHGSFERWARYCMQRKMIDQQRAEKKIDSILGSRRSRVELGLLPNRERSGNDLQFAEFTADLSDPEALVIWLRYYRGLSVEEVAALVKVAPRTVVACTQNALAALTKQWGNCLWDELPTYL